MTASFNRLDLNLLRVFDALMEERSVLRAGQRLCLSQSAISHALARLREMLEDDLFVRTTAGMKPTTRALAMAPLIRDAWKSLEAAIGLPKFEPATSTRRFTIAVSDFVTAVMVPDLLGLLRREAPRVDLVIRPDFQTDLTEQIDLGQIDAAVGTFADGPTRFRFVNLFEYDDVLVANSSFADRTITTETLSTLSMATVSLHREDEDAPHGYVSMRGLARRTEMYDRNALERALGSLRRPRVAVSLPHFLALPALLQRSDLVAIVPRPLANSLISMHPLRMYELPYKASPVQVSVLWNERNADDAPQKWLREILSRATEPLRARLVECESPTCLRSPPARPHFTEACRGTFPPYCVQRSGGADLELRQLSTEA